MHLNPKDKTRGDSANGVSPLLVQTAIKFDNNTRFTSHSQEGGGLTPCSSSMLITEAFRTAGSPVDSCSGLIITLSHPSSEPRRIEAGFTSSL